MRVALGPIEVAGTVSALAGGLRDIGVEVEVVLRSAHPFGYPADRILGPLGRIGYGLTLPFRVDVLHYQYGSTWSRGQADARLARARRRVRLATFHGDDCRLGIVAKKLFPARGRVKGTEGDAATTARLAELGSLCHAAIVNDFELATYVAPFFERVVLLPLALPGPPPPRAAPAAGRPVVVHSPSDPRVKGTGAIEVAVAAIEERMPVDFRLLHGVPHRTVESVLATASVVVDQLNSVTTGVFALESMRRGLPVCGEIDRRALAPFQKDLPLVDVTADTLAPRLEQLLADPDLRAQLGERGREFVERVHAAPRVAEAARRIYVDVADLDAGIYVASAEALAPIELPDWIEEPVAA